jgi:amidohydrolase
MAAVDRFRVVVRGKQSHAAMPWQGVDPIVATAYVITAIQTIPVRHIDARQPVVVSVGIVKAGTAWNIIPGEVTLEGTIRTHDAEARRKACEEFRRLVTQTAAAHGTQAEIALSDYGPMVLNDPPLTARIHATLVQAAGQSHVVEVQPMMGGEDFANYQQKVPGVFCFLGVRNPACGAVFGLHTPQMRIDEAALPVGVRTHVLLALNYLRGAGK